MGVLTPIDRAALAAYCQAYGRWVEAEEKLEETPALFKTPSGYVQQSPWLAHRRQAARTDGPLHGGARHDAGVAQPGGGGDPRMELPDDRRVRGRRFVEKIEPLARRQRATAD